MIGKFAKVTLANTLSLPCTESRDNCHSDHRESWSHGLCCFASQFLLMIYSPWCGVENLLTHHGLILTTNHLPNSNVCSLISRNSKGRTCLFTSALSWEIGTQNLVITCMRILALARPCLSCTWLICTSLPNQQVARTLCVRALHPLQVFKAAGLFALLMAALARDACLLLPAGMY
jgi:hypothetical protein